VNLQVRAFAPSRDCFTQGNRYMSKVSLSSRNRPSIINEDVHGLTLKNSQAIVPGDDISRHDSRTCSPRSTTEWGSVDPIYRLSKIATQCVEDCETTRVETKLWMRYTDVRNDVNTLNTRDSTAFYEHWRIAFSERPFSSDRSGLYRTQCKTASAKNLQQTG